MNRRTWTCLLAAAALASCGRTPSPVPQRAEPAGITTTTTATATTTTTTTSVVPVPIATTPSPKPPPKPPRTTTTTKPPPPPPRPPDRWVLPANLRGSIEQRGSQPFPGVWTGMQDELASACPGKKVCVGYTLVVDPSIVNEQDCFIGKGGIKVPDPLHEGGKITFRVNNDKCAEG